MSVPKEVIRLIETFRNNIQSFKSGNYNETQVRVEFIDPLFVALGWDVFNKNQYAEAYKDVIHEYSQKTTDTTKTPDYCFRIGGKRKFFVEAKKPSVNLKDDIHPAYQLRRYGWSAKLPLCILTDFEEFAVYDCRIQPKKTDKASTARILFLTYEDYPDKWDELVDIFSKDAILKGSFDKYAESNKKKRGTADVDEAFLKEMEEWRNLLARNIALRNSSLSIRELNFSVQKTIDRIIFLRICEDRGIENYGQLMSLLNGENVYERLKQIFTRADEKYNSGLFHFEKEKDRIDIPDEITLSLQIDDKILKEIFKKLYYPESPYEFSVLPADILGHVYEQFLGKVIRLTPAHYAVVEDKPEVKKAGGVYYTPTYIVDYIVKNTVDKILENKKPKDISNIRILDPACGSGSFLLGAFQYLLDWHLKYYTENEERISDSLKKRLPPIYQIRNNEYKLTTAERKRILLNNIYGVDIDSQAVEVTKLSLLLKVLEGESEETLTNQMKMFNERALPDLANNIKCGNSLIGPDFYDQMEMNFLNDEEKIKINVFDWESEFKEIMDSGGFDVVIGNPPWISLTGKFKNEILSELELNYLINKYIGNTYMPNLYEYFISAGIQLIKNNGVFSFITPDRLGFNNQFINLRNVILTKTKILSLKYKLPFPNITADTLVFVLQKSKDCIKNEVEVSEYGSKNIKIKQEDYLKSNDYVFYFFKDIKTLNLLNKVSKNKQVILLSNIIATTSGFGGKSKLITTEKISDKQIKTLKGDCIGRYKIIKHYWFEFKKDNITGRTTNKEKLGFIPKILLRKTGNSIIATYDDSGIFPEQSLYFLYNPIKNISYKYLLGLMNSKLINFYFANKLLTNKESIAQVKKEDLDIIPILFDVKMGIEFKMYYEKIETLVNNILQLKINCNIAKTPTEKTALQRQIDATDKQIDKLVYELYGITEEEIKVVEGE